MAMVVEDYIAKLYLNGQLVDEEDAKKMDFTYSNNEDLYFGIMYPTWYPFKGKIDDIRIYNRVLSASDVQSLYGSEIIEQPVDSHQYVDLGLPSGTLWAKCNIGATSEEQYGDYFAWGETKKKSSYSENNYSKKLLTKYFNTGKKELDVWDDAAYANWGAGWRIPSDADFLELILNTTSEWTTYRGIKGRMFTASNGQHLFLPGAGLNVESYGSEPGAAEYWTTTISHEDPTHFGGWPNGAGCYYDIEHWKGMPVRAIYTDKIIDDTKQVTAIEFGNAPTMMVVGETYQLIASVYPDDALTPEIYWASNNKDVATVTQDGIVTAIAPGVVKIRAKAQDGTAISTTCQITVKANEWIDGTNSKIYAYRGFKNFSTPTHVTGMTADGMAQIFITCPDGMKIRNDLAPGILYYDAKGNQIELFENEKIRTYLPKYESKFEANGYALRAPEDFLKDYKYDHYVVKVFAPLSEPNGEGKSSEYLASFKVYRSGVALIHGLWSDSECFEPFRQYLIGDGTFINAGINVVNYNSTAGKKFDYNSNIVQVVYNACDKLYTDLLEQDIVSYAYDLVGHSMGGILSRLYAQNETNKKHVHKIITVNTPHWGSPLGDIGDALPEFDDTDIEDAYKDYENADSRFMKGYYATKFLTEYLWKNKDDKMFKAVRDLATGSNAIKDLSKTACELQGIPVHAVTSYMYDEIIQDVNEYIYSDGNYFYDLYLAFKVLGETAVDAVSCKQLLKIALEKLFDEPRHDGVVGLTSQLGGLSETMKYVTLESAPFKGYGGNTSDAHHCNTCSWIDTKKKLVELLNEEVSSEFFCKDGFGEIDDNYLYAGNVKKLAKNKVDVQGTISTYKYPQNPDCHLNINHELVLSDDCWNLNITLDKSDDINRNMIFAQFNENDGFVEMQKDQYSVHIPTWFSDTLIVCALGATDNNEIVGDTIYVDIPALTNIDYISLEGVSSTMFVGQKNELSCKAIWENDQVKNVTPEYSSSDPSVIFVEDNEIHALSEGECTITASYKGHESVTRVKVEDKGELTFDNDDNYENDIVPVIAANGKQDIYSVSGIKLNSIRKGVNIIRQHNGNVSKVIR